jgi:hypothetical protein
MKTLTICQPYAELIIRGDKLVENRIWTTHYRGPLLIHAGKSRDWIEEAPGRCLDLEYGLRIADMAFGAIIGVCELVASLSVPSLRSAMRAGRFPELIRQWGRHIEGPDCLVLRDPRRFRTPIPYRGKLGLFDVPDDVVRAAIDEMAGEGVVP